MHRIQALAANVMRSAIAALRLVTDFTRSCTATAAVEFAIVLPVALLLYAGAAEVSDGVIASRHVTTLTKSLVDLLSLQGTTTQASSTPTPGNALSATTLSS